MDSKDVYAATALLKERSELETAILWLTTKDKFGPLSVSVNVWLPDSASFSYVSIQMSPNSVIPLVEEKLKQVNNNLLKLGVC